MAKVKIKGKLPEGYSLVNGKVVRSFKEGGATKKTLQPVSREAANLEAEKNETALTDLDNDGSFELYNIGGKRHSEGGTPLNLPEQTFVFSDTRKMLLSKEELEELGIESKKKMTPAKASKKFPLNEYIDVLQDEHSDEIAIRSAEEMLNKNKLKLSQIAFMQESKKDFSDGLPVAAYPFLMSQGIDPQEFEAKIQEQNAPQQGQQGQMSQEQMAMGPPQGNLQQFTGPPQGGPPMGPPQGGMPPMGPPPGPGGEGMPPPEVMQQLMAQQGQGGPPMGKYGTETHIMPDGTVHPGATHEEYMAMMEQSNYRNGGALRSFVYGGSLPKAQNLGEFGTVEEGGRGIGVCGELKRIREGLLFELKEAEGKGEAMDVIKGLHTKLQQVDRDMHDCMVKLMTDERNRRLPKTEKQAVPLLKPIMPELNLPMPNPDLAPGNTSRGQFMDIECNGPEAERLAMQCQAQGLQFDPAVCDCIELPGYQSKGETTAVGSVRPGIGTIPSNTYNPELQEYMPLPQASSVAIRPRNLFGNIGTRIGNVFRSDENDIDPTQVVFDPATGEKLSRDQQILLNQGPQPGERMSVGSVYKQGGCTSCQKNLRRFTDGGSPSAGTPMGGAPSDMAGWGANYDTPNRMSEEQLMLMQLDNYRRELLKEYELTQAKVSAPDFVADKETQEQIAFTFQTLEMKLDQVEQKASELQELMIQKNSQIPLFPHLDNTQSMSPQTTPGQGYYRFGGDTLNKFVYGGSLPKYQKKGEKTTDLQNAGYSKYLGNDHELGDHAALMKLVDEGVLKRESVSGSFYYANVCSDINGNPVDGENAEDCKTNGGHWVPSKRQKSKTSKLDNEQNPISNERVQGRQAGSTAIDILNNPSFAPVLQKITEEYKKNASSVKRGSTSNKDNWVGFDDFGGEQGMMNAFFSVNSYLNEAQQDGLAFCGQLGEDGKEHSQQYEYKTGKFQSVSKCKSIECCKNIDRENQKKLGVSIDDETARMFQGVYYTLDKLKNVDKDEGTIKLFEQLNVNPIGLKRSSKSKHFGADGKSPVSLVDGVIGGTSSGQFFTPTETEDSTIIEDEWNNPCDQKERDAKRKECTQAGKGFDAKECDCYELPEDPGKTKIPRYETFPRDDRALLNRLEQYNEIEQINPNLIQEDRYAPDPAYLDPRAKLASIEANVQEAIKNDPKNASFLMGKASELTDKTINEFENLNNKIYTGANKQAVDARNEEEEVNKSHLKTFYDESAMARENYNVERQESKDAWVETAGQREENADEMYIRNFENPNFWFSPQEHAINFYNEKGLDPTKHQNIDWNDLQRNAPKDENAAKLYWDKVRQTYQINTPSKQNHLDSRTIPEETEIVKYGKEINRTRKADLMRSRKKLRKWILGIQ